jgi:hypothetical protein
VSKKRYSFFISDELNAGLKLLKERDGVPEAESIRRAVGEFLAKKGIASAKKAERKRAITRSRP